MNNGFSWTTGYYKKPDGNVVAVSLHETDLASAVRRFPDQWSKTENFSNAAAKPEEKKPGPSRN